MLTSFGQSPVSNARLVRRDFYRAVKIEHRLSIGRALLIITESTPIGQLKLLIEFWHFYIFEYGGTYPKKKDANFLFDFLCKREHMTVRIKAIRDAVAPIAIRERTQFGCTRFKRTAEIG